MASPWISVPRMRRWIFAIAGVPLIAVVASYFLLPGPSSHALTTLGRMHSGLDRRSTVVDGREIVYLEGGSGPVIVMIHGFGANKDTWTRFAGALTPNYRVVAPDLPGFGESRPRQGDRYDIESQTARLHGFVRALGLVRYHVIGSSMGGEIAGVLAHHWPAEVETLALVDALGVPFVAPTAFARAIQSGANPFLVSNDQEFRTLLGLLFHTNPWVPYPIYVALRNDWIERRPQLQSTFSDVRNSGEALLPLLPQIPARTLVLWGDSDQILPVEGVHVFEQKLPHAKVVVMKDCGHLPMIEHPEEAALSYRGFLAAH